MTRNIAVLGAGSWGTALANLAARGGAKVSLWARDADHIAEMRAARENARRLPGVRLADGVTPTADLASVAAADAILAVVPAQAMREMTRRLAPILDAGVPVVACAKGIERGSGAFMSEIFAAELPHAPYAILSGPSFAEDVGKGLPTAVTLAAHDLALAEKLARMLAAPWFRLYHSDDVRGVEIGGAAKNVLAIASGVAAGRGLGASAGAALIARGFAELTRFGRAYGARPETLMGLSGLGDLVLTCGSAQSRNFALGLSLGRGQTPQGKLAEGAFTASVLVEKARNAKVEMPISAAVDAILAGQLDAAGAVEALLSRPSKAEI